MRYRIQPSFKKHVFEWECIARQMTVPLARGMVFKAPGARALSGLKAYERLPHVEAGPKRWSKPDPRTDLAGVHWSMHLEATDTWIEHNGPCRTRCLARAGPGRRLSLVPRVSQSRGTDTFIPLLCDLDNILQ
jgi:hypothetical protein